jgi:hypothetical protein
MESVVAALKDTPIPTILVIAGIAFLLLAIAGQVAGRIAVAPERQRWAALIGGGLLAIGLALHLVPLLRSQGTPPPVERGPASGPPTSPGKEPPRQPTAQPPQTPPTPMPDAQAKPELVEEKEPNNEVSNAIVITEGATVQGSIETEADRDVFKLHASSPKTWLILRKRFYAAVDVCDYIEKLVASERESGDKTLTFTFDSTPGSIYYIVVKSFGEHVPIRALGSLYHGEYQLAVRSE